MDDLQAVAAAVKSGQLWVEAAAANILVIWVEEPGDQRNFDPGGALCTACGKYIGITAFTNSNILHLEGLFFDSQVLVFRARSGEDCKQHRVVDTLILVRREGAGCAPLGDAFAQFCTSFFVEMLDKYFEQNLELPAKAVSWQCGLKAMRVGEASHPGPGGSRASERKRNQNQQNQQTQQSSGGGLNLGAIGLGGLDLQGMIENIVKQAIQKILEDLIGKGLNLNNLLGSGGGLQPEKEDADKEKGKTGNRDRQNGAQQPQRQATTGQQGAKRVSWADLSSTTSPPQAAASQRPQPAKGATEEGWEQVRAKKGPSDAKAELRKEDWDAAVAGSMGDLETSIEKCTQDGTLCRHVILTEDEEEASSAIMLARQAPRFAILALWPAGADKENSRRIPVHRAGKLGFLQVRHLCSNSEGMQPVDLKKTVTAAPKKVTVSATTVLRLTVDKELADDALWKSATSRPRECVMNWSKVARVRVQDTWGWQQEKRRGMELAVGLIRVDKSFQETAIATSGSQGIFVDPLAWRDSALPRHSVRWLEKAADEADMKAVLTRALATRPIFGVTRGVHQLGCREAFDSDAKVCKVWTITDVPRTWTDDVVCSALANAGFDKVDMIRRQPRGPTVTWVFKATMTADDDIRLVECTSVQGDEETRLQLWARIAPPRQAPTTRKPIKPTREDAAVLSATRQDLAREKVVVQNAGGIDGSGDGTPSGDAQQQEAAPSGGRVRAAARAAENPQSKRKEVTRRTIPEGMTRTSIQSDGNCLMEALAVGMNKVGAGKRLTGKTLRANIVAHMSSAKNKDRYMKDWDKFDDEDKQCDNFDTYLARVTKPGCKMGALEISAVARRFDIHIVVLMEQEDLEHMTWHPEGSATVTLWYSSAAKHYDLLEGALNQNVFATCAAGTTHGLRGGGRSCSGASSATAWTAATAWTPATVWTAATAKTKASASARKGASARGQAKRAAKATASVRTAGSAKTRGTTSASATARRRASVSAGSAVPERASGKAASSRTRASMSMGASTTPRVKRQRTGSKAEDLEQDLQGFDLEELVPPAPTEPAPVGRRGWQKGRGRPEMRRRFLPPEDEFKRQGISWRCPLCSWTTSKAVWHPCKERHLRLWHADDARAVRLLSKVPLGRGLGTKAQAEELGATIRWSCHLCDTVVMQQVGEELSDWTIRDVIAHHKGQKHEDVDGQEFRYHGKRWAEGQAKRQQDLLAKNRVRMVLDLKGGKYGKHDLIPFGIRRLPEDGCSEARRLYFIDMKNWLGCRTCRRVGPKKLFTKTKDCEPPALRQGNAVAIPASAVKKCMADPRYKEYLPELRRELNFKTGGALENDSCRDGRGSRK
jgi:hypothetical protein